MVVPADWKEVRLGDLGFTFSGLTGKSSKDFGEGNSSFVTFMNVMSNVILDSQGTENVRIGNGERQSQLLEGDVIFNGSSETPEEVGFGSAVPIELSGLYLNSFCFGFRRKDTKSLDPKFFAYLTRSPLGRNIIRPMAQGSTRYNIAKTNLLNGRFLLPPLKEQEAIAEALSDSDAVIESLDALITKKCDVKQAMMQQLLTGRSRLPGFNADWNEVRLSEVAEVDPENLSAATSPLYEFKYISLENVSKGRLVGFSEQVFHAAPSRARRILKDVDVLLATVRPNLLGHLLFRGDNNWIASTGFAVIRCKSEFYSPTFMYQVVFSHVIQAQIELLITGSNYPAINNKDVRELRVPLLPLKEQEAIAEALTVMDDELEALNEQVSKLRMVKEGMIQDLLTGKVRLI